MSRFDFEFEKFNVPESEIGVNLVCMVFNGSRFFLSGEDGLDPNPVHQSQYFVASDFKAIFRQLPVHEPTTAGRGDIGEYIIDTTHGFQVSLTGWLGPMAKAGAIDRH